MDLNTTQQVLLIILSSFLALFLITGIIFGVIAIKIMRHIKRITEKAEQIADKAESVTTFFQQTAGPAAMAKLVSNIVHTIREHKGK